MKILLVEDDRDYRAMLFKLLHAWGHDMLAVSDALHAIALLDEDNNGIDLVILDLNLPRLGGEEVMKTYAHWTKCRARFIVISGLPIPEHYVDHPKVLGCLDKPVSTEALKRALEQCNGIPARRRPFAAAAGRGR